MEIVKWIVAGIKFFVVLGIVKFFTGDLVPEFCRTMGRLMGSYMVGAKG